MSGRSILIIDDDMTLLDLIEYRFEEKGYEVTRCTDGNSAIKQCKIHPPDVILIDLMMPKMSGQVCITTLRNTGIQIPIVAFTAIDDPLIHEEALSAGCNLVLTKPCKLSILFDKIEQLLSKSE
jgi:two-component system alkaline phosphatase synthesis response regulator PhoP